MAGSTKRITTFGLAALLAGTLLAGCGKKAQGPDLTGTAEPDKVLFERATEDIKHGRHTIGRLTLQTLINTYPDSEYLAKAKLAIADSFYKEGGTAGLTQAIAEYKDFITFFPFLDEASYAQLRVAMAHYRRMEKPDRDRTEARLAEQEFQAFLLKYPEHEQAAEAEQRLREVQEVLAEGDYRIGRYYYIKGSLRAAAARLLEVSDRYTLYSQGDRVLWMLGDIFQRSERTDIAGNFYSRIVRDYPLSSFVQDAKEKLTKLGVPIPQPNPEALARMQRERELARQKRCWLRRSSGLFHTGPDVSMAARVGKPNLQPPPEVTGETLTPGGSLGVGGASGSSVVVDTVQPGAAGKPAAGAEEASKPKEAAAEAKPAPTDAVVTDKTKKKEDDKKKEKESTSKKKKGLRKLIPW